MNIDNPLFLFLVSAVVGLQRLLPTTLRRAALIPAANAAFLLAAPDEPWDLWPLGVLLILGFVFAKVQTFWPGKPGVKVGAVVAIVLLFAYLKSYSLIGALGVRTQTFFTFGMSYILFRIIHLIVDTAGNGQFLPGTFLRYWSYVTFFPALASGPVQLYPDFAREREEDKPLSAAVLQGALWRIVVGYVKAIVVSRFIISAQDAIYTQATYDGQPHVVLTALACVGYLFYLYFNFSGFTDVVIGIAQLLRIRLPENFLNAFSARNFLGLWSVWHISMSNWFRLYVFNPTITALARRWPSRKYTKRLGAVGYFLTFFVMGVWHGTTWSFLIYGLVLGSGASLNNIYQDVLKRRLTKQDLNALRANMLYRAVCRGATYAFFALGLTLFWIQSTDLRKFWEALGGWTGLIQAFLISATTFTILLESADLIMPSVRRYARIFAETGVEPSQQDSANPVAANHAAASFFASETQTEVESSLSTQRGVARDALAIAALVCAFFLAGGMAEYSRTYRLRSGVEHIVLGYRALYPSKEKKVDLGQWVDITEMTIEKGFMTKAMRVFGSTSFGKAMWPGSKVKVFSDQADNAIIISVDSLSQDACRSAGAAIAGDVPGMIWADINGTWSYFTPYRQKPHWTRELISSYCSKANGNSIFVAHTMD